MEPLFSPKTLPSRGPTWHRSHWCRQMLCVHNQGVHSARVQRSEQLCNSSSRGASSSSDVG